ncbi:hypothetical protein RM190_10165 [Paracoccus sp. CPCC 101403]|uniref:PH domain-containing protein n=1 Tax=Paracoccus broussonetiae TaxID=3075834 RepID=A0ABU3EDA5_9RHOB|nr:hypothetical protein [Paracoccus sp. CPCC 101403]MDT1062224.1 hypothetical protein [Paracoccus sp. CPCC 101403]
MSDPSLPPLDQDEQILLTGRASFRAGEVRRIFLVFTVLWPVFFIVMTETLRIRGGYLPPLATAIVTGILLLFAFMILTPAVWLMNRGRIWAVTNQRIIDNKGLVLAVSRIGRIERNGVIRSDGIPPFALSGADPARLREVLQPFLAKGREQFASVLPSGIPDGLPHPSASRHASFWSSELQPGEILLWAGRSGRFWPILRVAFLLTIVAASLFVPSQTMVAIVLLIFSIAVSISIARPPRFAITDRRVLVTALRLQRISRIGTSARQLPMSGASFIVDWTSVSISEASRGAATRFVVMKELSRADAKAVERVLFALIPRHAAQAYHPPPLPISADAFSTQKQIGRL